VVLDREKDADLPEAAELLLSDMAPTARQAVEYADLPRGGGAPGPVGRPPAGRTPAAVGARLGAGTPPPDRA
jgi:hypothetical protein